MKKTELPNHEQLWLLQFPGPKMPHGTIETNRTCNIRCNNCYNIEKNYVKPFTDIISEIDLLASRRNLQTITLMGGEPTLHPDLPRIVAYVKSKKIRCQILSNGITFLEDSGAELLEKLQKNGIDRITLHVDKGQRHIHADVDTTRVRLFNLLETRKVHFALSITIDTEERNAIPSLVKKYAQYRYFDGIIGFMASGLETNKNPGLNLKTETDAITRELPLEPTGYIPSNIDINEIRWLLYYFLIDARTGTVFPMAPKMSKLFSQFYQMVTGQFPFTLHLPVLFSALTTFSIIAASPHRLFRKISLCRSAFSTRFNYIVFQVPPEFTTTTETIELCDNCPDATVRNGKLLPLCIADFISPFDPHGKEPFVPEKKFREVIELLN